MKVFKRASYLLMAVTLIVLMSSPSLGKEVNAAVDTTRPVIQPVADAKIPFSDIDTWKPPKPIAKDNVDGDISEKVVHTFYHNIVGASFNSLEEARKQLKAGITITVKYIVADTSGNRAISVSATFTPVDDDAPKDTIAPIIKRMRNIRYRYGTNFDKWIPKSGKAYDNVDSDISDKIVLKYYTAEGTPLVDLEEARSVLNKGKDVVVTYDVTDIAGNKARTRKVLHDVRNIWGIEPFDPPTR